MTSLAALACAITLAAATPAFAEPVAVKFTEGVTHAFVATE